MNYQMAGTAGAPISQSQQERKATATDDIVMRLDKLIGEFGIMAERMNQIADRALGPAPQPTAAEAKAPTPQGFVGLLADKLQRLDNLAEWQRASMNRIEQVM